VPDQFPHRAQAILGCHIDIQHGRQTAVYRNFSSRQHEIEARRRNPEMKKDQLPK
jgi:hypothetical protein